jgi:hypothetical protein
VSISATGLKLQLLEVQDASEFDQAFSEINNADALLISPSVVLFTERNRIAAQAAKHMLPLFSVAKEFTELEGLMSYGASINDLMRRAASYADKIRAKLSFIDSAGPPPRAPLQDPCRDHGRLNATWSSFAATLKSFEKQQGLDCALESGKNFAIRHEAKQCKAHR